MTDRKSLTAMWHYCNERIPFGPGFSLTQFKMTAKAKDIGQVIGHSRVVSEKEFDKIVKIIASNKK